MHAIFCRIGAGDVGTKGLSTFAKEMMEASTLIQAARPGTLVLIDELGRGTSTYDGCGLSMAIAEHLASAGPCALIATHFHEMTALERTCPGVINCHVSVETAADGKLRMLYRVSDGPCNKSYGLQIAQQSGWDADVIRVAFDKASELEQLSTANQPDDEHRPKRVQVDGSEIEQLEATVQQQRVTLQQLSSCLDSNPSDQALLDSVKSLLV